MTSERNFPKSNQGKGKTPNTSIEAGAARPHAKRAPTNANKLDEVLERVAKLEALQRQPTETPAISLRKRSAEIPPEVLEHIRHEKVIPRPIPRRQVKIMVRKKAAYSEPEEDTKPAEEPLVRKEWSKEPYVAPESCGETRSAIQTPPVVPEMSIPPMHVRSSSTKIPGVQPAESVLHYDWSIKATTVTRPE
ncbi:hypothetical protein ACLOJK_012154 [Asimina triloba]